ncbi:MAG: hypothetical protein C9356_08000 [Oleiphilus sp.]|nr:MAG: hypothetical protein C9356_08000 [Oleiphilus sp.]
MGKTSSSGRENAVTGPAAQLLELHVAHEMQAFTPESFIPWLKTELPLQFDYLNALNLRQLVSPEQIKAVIARNVVENKLPGAIAELAGDAASALFGSEAHTSTRLNEILSAGQFEEFVDKLLELKEQRKTGIDHLIDLPIYQELISGVLYQAILRYIYDENVLSKSIPGVSSMLKFGKRMIDKTAPSFDGAVEESVRNYIEANLGFLLRESKAFLENSLTEEDIKASALELWDALENKTLGDFQEGMNSLDLSEFVVLGYEFWQRFRKLPYFQSCVDIVVDFVFERYGEMPLDELCEELMLSQEQLLVEAEAFAPRLLQTLKENGQLEALIRRRLSAFYASAQTQAFLETL